MIADDDSKYLFQCRPPKLFEERNGVTVRIEYADFGIHARYGIQWNCDETEAAIAPLEQQWDVPGGHIHDVAFIGKAAPQPINSIGLPSPSR